MHQKGTLTEWLEFLTAVPKVVVVCYGAVVKHQTRDQEIGGSIPACTKCCVLEQDTLSTLLGIWFLSGKIFLECPRGQMAVYIERKLLTQTMDCKNTLLTLL